MGEDNTVYTVDLVTGEATKAFTVSVTNPTTTSAAYGVLLNLAIDDAGNFYSVNYSTTASPHLPSTGGLPLRCKRAR